MAELQRRLTVAAAAVVLVVLVVASVGLVVAQRRTMTDALDDSLRQRADDVAALVRARDVPTRFASGDDTAVQVVDAAGDVLAATTNVSDGPPLGAAPDGDDDVVATVDRDAIDEDPVRLLSRRVDDVVVHVAMGADDVDDSVAALARSLAIAVPLLTMALGGAAWWLVGRTLRPVALAAERERRFVGDAAHELRTPLTRMRAELEVDLAHPDGADQVRTHRSVLEEVVGLQRLVDGLLHLARSDAGAALSRQEAVDVGAIVRHQAEQVGGEAHDQGEVIVLGDEAGLDRAIGNLVDNASRYATSAVVVSASREDGRAIVTVTDDGSGIPVHEHERVFERFARLDDSRTSATGGVGLGLSIARAIVAAHGGTVAVDPSHAPGARLVVSLPLAGPASSGTRSPAAAREPTTPRGAR